MNKQGKPGYVAASLKYSILQNEVAEQLQNDVPKVMP